VDVSECYGSAAYAKGQLVGEKTNLGGGRKGDEKEMSWTIGRERKDSKGQKKKGKENNLKTSASFKRMYFLCFPFLFGFPLFLTNHNDLSFSWGIYT